MTEDEKRLLEQELKKAGSIPALLEAMARGESEDFGQLRKEVEEGPYHPSGDDLYNYVLGWLEQEHSLRVLDHVVLCGRCLEEVMKIQQIEEALTKDALERADKLSWTERVRNFISSLSFPVSIYVPALEPVRRSAHDDEKRSYTTGEEYLLILEAPADGYIAIFHGCEETGQVKLVFPLYSTHNVRVSADQDIAPIQGKVEGPAGKHFFKIFWTRVSLLDPGNVNLQDEQVRDAAVEDFFDALEYLSEGDWRLTTMEYEVVAE